MLELRYIAARRGDAAMGACVVEFGAHLPLMDFGAHPYTLDHLIAYAKTAAQLGFGTLAVNDHMTPRSLPVVAVEAVGRGHRLRKPTR